uniref:Uncharacterized protein n=1 Tax=Mola mola TaxID=94237 RepID=A0A3Q3WEM1_MOLML
MYAGRKRRKPVPKGVKPTPADGAKSNPSKRHRERLNSELDRLAGLLPFPEDVISSLDKLSILRLSVSFLRTKSFFSAASKNRPSNGVNESSGDSQASGAEDGSIPEGELLLQALNGFVLVVTAEGILFFCSHTIQDYLGFHQTDVMHQSVFELIHTEDQQELRRNLHWALNPPAGLPPSTEPPADEEPSSSAVSYDPEQLPPESSSFLERGFICRFRCLLDNSSGFLALNIQGRLKFLHGQNHPPQLALFAIATPLQPPAILEIRTRNMIFRTKHKLDFTPMACDAKGKIVLGYTEAELRVRGSGYQFIHAADMLYCAENHVRMIKTGESGLTVFRLLTKDNRWKWVQANARLVYKNGKPDYIIATQRPLVDEEGGEHLRKRSMHLPFTFATGEAMIYQTGYPLHSFSDSLPKAKGSKSKKSKTDKSFSDDLEPKSLLGALMSQDESVYVCQPDTEPTMSYHSSLFSEQQADSEYGSLLGHDSLHIISNGETARSNRKTNSYDPLLATLDSLSLDGEETCSNSELFSALENLGLNAEDLELLLLDERMMQVELDPNHIPTLSDLLTNNEILSYVHDALENGAERPEEGDTGGFGVNPDLSQSRQPRACPPAVPAAPPSSRQPVVQLSQQMLQHISAGELAKAQPGTLDHKILTGPPNASWVTNSENHHHPNNHTHHQQWQLQQDQHLVQFPSHQQLSSFQDHPQLTTNESYVPNGHAALPSNVEVSHMGYSITPAPHAGAAGLNGVTSPDLCDHQSYQLQQIPVPAPCLSQCPTQRSTLELEQLLGLSQPQHSLPSSVQNLDTADTCELENSCLLSATNATYIRTCLVPNGNGVAAGNIAVSNPDGLSVLHDPQKYGFFL